MQSIVNTQPHGLNCQYMKIIKDMIILHYKVHVDICMEYY